MKKDAAYIVLVEKFKEKHLNEAMLVARAKSSNAVPTSANKHMLFIEMHILLIKSHKICCICCIFRSTYEAYLEEHIVTRVVIP